MKKRTNVDFSKHLLYMTETGNFKMHWLKIPKSSIYNVKFINTNGVMIVTGDVGNWIFCREFHPSKEFDISEPYWCEKLENYSTQKPYEFDEETAIESINELIEKYREEYPDYFEEAYEFFEGIKNNSHDEFEFVNYWREYMPEFIYYEDFPCINKTNKRLLVIFDAFEEICSRL